MIAVAIGIVVVVAIIAGLRAHRALRTRVAALESHTDAAQRWQDEVRKALATGSGK